MVLEIRLIASAAKDVPNQIQRRNPKQISPSLYTRAHGAERMDFAHTGMARRDPKVGLIRTLYAGSRSPWFLETALVRKIMATETLYEGIQGLSSAVKVARLD